MCDKREGSLSTAPSLSKAIRRLVEAGLRAEVLPERQCRHDDPAKA